MKLICFQNTVKKIIIQRTKNKNTVEKITKKYKPHFFTLLSIFTSIFLIFHEQSS
jgi:hypothetical protein